MRRKLLAALLLSLTACQDVPAEPETPYTGPVNVSVQAASTQFVRCGEQIPVTVTVTGSNGKPVSGFHLNFNVLEGGGRMFGGAALTNSKGVARDLWTIGGTANLSNTLAVRAVDPGTGVGTTYFTQTVTSLSKIAFESDRGGYWGIYVMNADGSNQKNLTNNGAYSSAPAWSPDGSQIAFMRINNGDIGIYVMNADGSNQRDLTTNSAFDVEPAWSPDGSRIAFRSLRDGNAEIYVMNADGSNPTRLTTNPARDAQPAWSGCTAP